MGIVAAGPSLYVARYEELENEIRDKANRMGIPSPVLAVVSKIAEIPQARKNSIILPPTFLIKTADLPSKFRLTNADDPRLYDNTYLQELADWIQDVTTHKKQRINSSTQETLRLFLKFHMNPALAEQAKSFVLSHEIAHILHEHGKRYLSGVYKVAALVAVVAGALLAVFVLACPPVLTTVVALVALTLLLIAGVSYRSHKNEKEADLTAVTRIAPETKRGGVYLFRLFTEHGLAARKKSFRSKILYDGQGNNRLLKLTHPLETTRIKYLSNT